MKTLALGLVASMLALSTALAAEAAPVPVPTIDPSKPVIQTAIARVKPGAEEAFKQAVEKILQATRSEAGNISYTYAQSVTDPTEFLFVEVWKSEAAVDFHMNTSYLKDFFNEVGPMFRPGYPILTKYQDAEQE